MVSHRDLHRSFFSFHERPETFSSAWAFFYLVLCCLITFESTFKIDDSYCKLLERKLVEEWQSKERNSNTNRIMNVSDGEGITHSCTYGVIYDVQQLSPVSGNILCNMITCSNGYYSHSGITLIQKPSKCEF